jgi:NAD dependent epimerase/dehydratase
MESVLVTGSEGFIGSHVTEELAKGSHDLTALVQYNSFAYTGWLQEATFGEAPTIRLGDIRDPNQMLELSFGADVVVHLASLIAIPFSYEAPHAYVETNILGTLNLLTSARTAGVRRFVHTSTSEVYGTAKYVPIDENHPLQAQSPYSASKIGADALVRSYVDSFDFPAVTLRPFNTFGPRQSQRAVIPTLGAQFLAKAPRIKVGALKPTRDFTFVTDTAKAFALSMTAPGIEGEVINLGTGWEVSVEGIIDLLADLTGHKPEIELDEGRLRPHASEVERLLSDNSKAKRLLGWEPQYVGESGFREGLKLTLDWLEKELVSGRVKPDTYVR